MNKIWKNNFVAQSFTDSAHLPDNRDEFRKELEFSKNDYEIKVLEERLAYLDKFPPGIEHTRICAQRFEVYSFKDLKFIDSIKESIKKEDFWCKRDYLIKPVGTLTKILEIDVGDIVRFRTGRKKEIPIESNIVHYLEDGSFIRGTRFRYESVTDLPNWYSDLFEVVTELHEDKDCFIRYKIKHTTIDDPLAFKIMDYLKTDNQLVYEEIMWARPLFNSKSSKFVKYKFNKI